MLFVKVKSRLIAAWIKPQEVSGMDRLTKKLSDSKWALATLLGLILYGKSLFLLFTLYEVSVRVVLLSLLSIAPIALVVSFIFLFAGRGRWKYFFLVNVFFSVLFYADMVYFKGLNQLFSVYVLYIKNISFDFGSSASGYFMSYDFVVLLDLPVFLLMLRKSRIYEKEQTLKPQWGGALLRRTRFAVALTLSGLLMATQVMAVSGVEDMENFENHALLLSPVGNHLVNMASFVAEKVMNLTEGDRAEIKDWFEANAQNLTADETHAEDFGVLKGKNIVVLHFESLENFVLQETADGQEITPNLNRILKESYFFSGVREQVREGTSSDTELMFNTGLYPTQKGSAFMSYAENTYFALPKLLKSQGYATMTLHGDDSKFWNRDVMYPTLGIERYIDESLFEDKRYSGLGILDESLFQQSLLEIGRTKEPFYAYIMTVTSHTPFNLEEEYRYLGLPGDTADAGYLESIHYTDYHFGKFYEELKKKGLLENTAFVIFGDHEGIHKYHETELPENDKKIPFIVHVPGMKGEEIDRIGGQIDMLPTLLYLLGEEESTYGDKVMGTNLFHPGTGSVILASGEIIGDPEDPVHLQQAGILANKILAGDYFKPLVEDASSSMED